MTRHDTPYDLPTFDEDAIEVDLPRREIPTDDLGMLETFLESRWRKSDFLHSSYTTYERNLAKFFEWLEANDKLADPVQVESTDIVNFAEDMQHEYSDTTISSTINCISTFYNYFVKRSRSPEVTSPVKAAREDLGITPNERDWPHISIDEMAEFIDNIVHPRDRAEVLLFAKFGPRLSEVYNLDLQDISIDYAPLNRNPYYASIETRPELEGREDVIYIDPDIRCDQEFRGVERTGANKRKVATYLPLDGELKHALVRWLAARPATYSNPTHPLFTGEYSRSKDYYRRHSLSDIQDQIQERADDVGWNDRADDITPHFFRHYFTTHHRLSMDDLLLDYIRGDRIGSQRRGAPGKPKSGKAKQDYTQAEWIKIKKPYLNSVYKFGLPRLPVSDG